MSSTQVCGLKQTPRAMYNALIGYLSSIGFVKTKSHVFLLVKDIPDDTLFVLVYVDGIIVTRSNTFSVNQVITSFASQFSIKDLGDLHYFQDDEVICSSGRVILTQANYVNDIINDELMSDYKSVKYQ